VKPASLELLSLQNHEFKNKLILYKLLSLQYSVIASEKWTKTHSKRDFENVIKDFVVEIILDYCCGTNVITGILRGRQKGQGQRRRHGNGSKRV
jgi:hypothetical protein